MERILVGIDATRPAWEALTRAVLLAGRIAARLTVLLVLRPAAAPPPGVRRRVDLEIEAAKASGVGVEFYVAEGAFAEEVIHAAGQFKTTLLVAPAPGPPGEERSAEAEAISHILNGVDCRVELVSPKKNL